MPLHLAPRAMPAPHIVGSGCAVILFLMAFTHAVHAQDAPTSPPIEPDTVTAPRLVPHSITTSHLGRLPDWDDGLSEMCYYRASKRIYGLERRYVRVHLVNREWWDPREGVKTESPDDTAVPVLKLNIAEEIPTENYNYRLMTSVFLRRTDLRVMKTVSSTQEWCGTTFKHLRRHDDALTLRSFSYFAGEGDQTWTLSGDTVPHEALLLIAREAAATGRPISVNVLAPLRDNRGADPTVTPARLIPREITDVTVSAGTFQARRVDVEWSGPITGFVVEAVPPFRLLRFRTPIAQGELQFIERRAYWDRNWKSGFHPPGEAP